MPVDLTSTWIPLSLLAVLSVYMFILFKRERREALAFQGEAASSGHEATPATHADHGHDAHGHDAHAAPAAHAAAPAETHHAEAPKKKKASLKWRTAHIWLPFVAGFGWQAYLDFIKPMLEKAAG